MALQPLIINVFLPYFPLLTEAFNLLLLRHSFCPETLLVFISIIPKPNSDDTTWYNYRPISKLNLDIKLLAKILSNRINQTFIHKDQTGFIPSRQKQDNIRRATLLANMACTHDPWLIPVCFLSIDIQKAFGYLSWHYLKSIFHRWGFGTYFLQCIASLYNNPKAYSMYFIQDFTLNP